MPTNPGRVLRLTAVGTPAAGWLRVARCRACGHIAPFPQAALIQRLGATHPVEAALWRLRCQECGERGTAEHRLLRLCEPGCPKQRG